MPYKTENAAYLIVSEKPPGIHPSDLVNSVRKRLSLGQSTVMLDCANLTHVCSNYISVLWKALRECQKSGGSLRITEISDELARILDMLELLDLFLESTDSRAAVCRLASLSKYRTISGPESYSDEFYVEDSSIQAAQDRFMRFLRDQGFSEQDVCDLRIVFYEVSNNVQSHGGLESDSVVHFLASTTEESIQLTFIDHGKEFDLTAHKVHPCPADSARNGDVRGYGIPLLRRLCSSMSYARDKSGYNILTLEKTWEAPK